jgi:hypothetical protein
MSGRRLAVCVTFAVAFVLTGCSASGDRGLPTSLPPAVSIIPGTVAASSVDGMQWQVWVKSPDVVAGYKTARKLLVKAGFDTTYDNVYSTSGEGQFCTAKYCVDVNAYDDPSHGKTVGYEIYRNSALGVPKG